MTLVTLTIAMDAYMASHAGRRPELLVMGEQAFADYVRVIGSLDASPDQMSFCSAAIRVDSSLPPTEIRFE